MAIESIEPVGQGARPQPTVSDESPSAQESPSFASTLDEASVTGQAQGAQSGPVGGPVEAAPTIPAPASVESTQAAAAAEPVDAVESNAAAEVLERIGDGHARLDALIAEIRSGQPFTAQELLGLQVEVFKLTLELEATTNVVSQAIGNVRTLFQQQV
jgi:hypothetical protein